MHAAPALLDRRFVDVKVWLIDASVAVYQSAPIYRVESKRFCRAVRNERLTRFVGRLTNLAQEVFMRKTRFETWGGN
jgi:hypothetical protein